MAKTEVAQLALIGGGPMARAVGRILPRAKIKVSLWARRPEAREQLRAELPGVRVEDELGPAVADAPIVFIAVPANELESAAERYGAVATGDQVVLCATRGVGPGFRLAHELIRAKSCVRKIGVLGGPLHARELEMGRQINLVLASHYPEAIEAIRALIKGTPIGLSASRDVVGVEIAGAIANVASIAAGMAEGLELSETARGVLLTHGLVEAKRLGTALGAEDSTFAGLAGVGELIPRRVTSMDRHLELGRLLAKGTALGSALTQLEGQVEGVLTALEATAKAKLLRLELPLVSAVSAVLEGSAAPKDVLEAVLKRSLELDARPSGRASA